MNKEHLVSAWETVDVPQLIVWDLLCQVDRYHEWVESTEQLVSADGPACLGATYVSRTRLSGFWMGTISWEVAEFEPPRRQVHVGSGVRYVRDLRKELSVTEDGDRCEFRLTYAYVPVGPLGAVLEFAAGTNVTAEQRRSVRSLAMLAEHEHGVARPDA